MVRVKVCGITSVKDGLLAVELGADAIGLIFFPDSPRSIAPEEAARVVERLPPFVVPVGVFVNETADRIHRIQRITGIRVAQLSGEEPEDLIPSLRLPVIRAFRVGKGFDEEAAVRSPASAVLLDAHVKGLRGGTGQTFDWDVARRVGEKKPTVLAGGLDPQNVARAVETARPYAVDVASGVEASPGKKDPDKVRAFIAAAKGSSQLF